MINEIMINEKKEIFFSTDGRVYFLLPEGGGAADGVFRHWQPPPPNTVLLQEGMNG